MLITINLKTTQNIDFTIHNHEVESSILSLATTESTGHLQTADDRTFCFMTELKTCFQAT